MKKANTPKPAKRLARRGFNLVEAAIVLGVVGLVIGGIWTAASQAQLALRVSTMQKDILSSCRALGSVIPPTLVPDTANGDTGSGTESIVVAGYNAGIFPKSWTLDAGNVVMNTPMGPADARIYDKLTEPPMTGYMDIFFRTSRAECIRMVNSLGRMNASIANSQGAYNSPLLAISVFNCTDATLINCGPAGGNQANATLFRYGNTDIDAVAALCGNNASVSVTCK